MADPILQTSFSAGEISPALYAHVDLAKYKVGAALLENFMVDFRGGAINRPGSVFVGQCLMNPANRFDTTKPVRNIPFTFSTIQTYMLEFGHLYMRVIKDGAYVTQTAKTITAATKANPGVITSIAHGFSNGDWIYIAAVGGMTQLNGRIFVVAGATTDTFTLKDLLTDTAINTTSYGAYTSGGTASRIFTLTTTYAAADLALLKFAQSNDTMTLTHPSYAPKDLTRSGHASWTLTDIIFASSTTAPATPGAVASNAGTTSYNYKVTAVNAAGTEESPPSLSCSTTSAAMSQTAAAHITVTWSAVPGASRYNVYRTMEVIGSDPGTSAFYGYVGSTTSPDVNFVDANIAPDFTRTPPLVTNPFSGSNNPGCNSYFNQRQSYAGSTSLPETFNMSQPGNRKNFNISVITQANDAITGTLASLQVNAIQHLVPMSTGLIALTAGSAFQISGGTPIAGSAAAITPDNAIALAQSFSGCDDVVPPLVINDNILYVQAMGSTIRNLAYNFYVNIYTGNDISILSSHLFLGRQVKEWCWAVEPFKTVWAVRDDGILLSLAYLKEQEVNGWAHHNTDGFYRSIAQIQEGDESAVYMVAERYIQGKWIKYQERMASRLFGRDITAAWFLDCALASTLTYPAATLSPAAATGSNITFTASAAIFTSPGSVGSIIRVNNGIARITAVDSTTVVRATILLDLDNIYPALANAWSCTATFTTISGLWHLEGETDIYALGDGLVQGPFTVTNGAVTLTTASSYAIVGKKYEANLQTLYIDTGEPTIQGKRKTIPAVTAIVQSTRGMKIGRTSSTLKSWKKEPAIVSGQLPRLTTGDERIVMTPLMDTYGQIYIQQNQPLPCGILGVIPELSIGDR